MQKVQAAACARLDGLMEQRLMPLSFYVHYFRHKPSPFLRFLISFHDDADASRCATIRAAFPAGLHDFLMTALPRCHGYVCWLARGQCLLNFSRLIAAGKVCCDFLYFMPCIS